MNATFDFYAALSLAGELQALFWAAALATKKQANARANRILAAFLFLLALGFANFILYKTRLIFQWPHLAELATPLFFVLPPIFYFYVRALTDKKFRFRKKEFLHFIPFLLFVFSKAPFYLSAASEKIAYLQVHHDQSIFAPSLLSGFLFAQEIAYLIIILALYRRHALAIKSQHSSIEKLNLKWIRVLLIGFFVIAGLYVVQILIFGGEDRFFIVPIAMTVFVYLLGFRGMRQPEIFESAAANSQNEKYAKSALTDEQAQIYLRKLQDLMDEEQLFLQPDLTLPKLAKALSVSTNHLSQVINQQLKMSFFDFVNSRRVEEAKKLLLDESNNFVIEEIAYRVGFNSKSAFNAAFKKHVGQTPSQLKSLRQTNSDP